jgi:hypothetical protein
MKGFFLDITGIKPGGKSLTRTARCAHLYQYKVKRKILNEDSPPRRKHGFHLWIGTVTVIIGTWIFLAMGWIGLSWLY